MITLLGFSILTSFMQNVDDLPTRTLTSKQELPGITIESYKFYSQKWPINSEPTIPTTSWNHALVFYIPKSVEHKEALLYVDGGYNSDDKGQVVEKEPRERIDFAKIAQDNHAIVIELQDVPNQYLMMDGTYKREDQILAYTYRLFMQNKDPYIPGHLPMAKSIVKAMDEAEHILKDYNVDSFVLSGISKRGWAVWLAAIEDTRVKALIPIVIDVLNVQKSIMHICSVYENGCPYSFKDYKKEGVDKLIHTKEFGELMQIEDPLHYLNQGEKYQVQFKNLSKYIINAAGDDFFVPDNSHFYFKSLPGENNHIRYLPNAFHYFAGNPISDATGNLQKINEAVSNYFYYIVNEVALPKIQYHFTGNNITVESSNIPTRAILWTHHNEEHRDFRFIYYFSDKIWEGIFHTAAFLSEWITGQDAQQLYFAYKIYIQQSIPDYLSFLLSNDLCDRCYTAQEIDVNCVSNSLCEITAQAPAINKGWQSSFIELHYDIAGRDFVITTEVNLIHVDHLARSEL